MKVTAFHLADKVEEATRSYFTNSFLFSSRKIDVERTIDFRNHTASLQYFVRDGEERVPMGGAEFNAIQERDGKVAFQCRFTIQPSDYRKQFFVIMPSTSEQYVQYSRLAEELHSRWDKDANAYLPKNEAPPPPPEAPKSLDDEYASLSPEEIEAITGVRPEAKDAAPAPKADEVDMAEIQRLMGMVGNDAPTEPVAATAETSAGEAPAQPADGGMMMTAEEIEALARSTQPQGQETAAPVDVAGENKAAENSDLMNAEEIWKQINGGK